MSDENELDMDFEIIEEPVDEMFPRVANVISHRGHKIKILAVVRNVPELAEVTTISLKAKVLVLDRETMGEKRHVSRRARIWGEAREVKVTFPSAENPSLPFSIQIVVPEKRRDDHLGQGPDYEAWVNVTPSAGDTTEAAAPSTSNFEDKGLYVIGFTSK